jgi:mannitol/fructose-specific phosphotransferase system IIA component (Ntr-type)
VVRQNKQESETLYCVVNVTGTPQPLSLPVSGIDLVTNKPFTGRCILAGWQTLWVQVNSPWRHKMNLLTLTHADFIFINPEPRTPEALIRYMSDSLARRGVIHDKHAFIDSVLHRESEGPTALGEELAVPHGKSELSPRRPSACTFEEPITWPGWRGDEKVRMVFLLAIPSREAEAPICSF